MAKPTRFAGSEPLNIYQDDFFENAAPMVNHAPMPPVEKPQRRPLQSSNGNVVLNPPNATSAKQSPFKSTSTASVSPLTPLRSSHGNKLGSVSIMPPTMHQQATDSMPKKQPVMSRFKTVTQKPWEPSAYVGKENAHPMIYPAPATPTISFENYYQKPSGKRVLLEPAPIKEARPQKKPKLDDGPLPPPDSFPPIIDDGAKPGHSYATLIGMAILRASNRRLTLSQIYKWISDTFSFYKPDDAGWQNSIRHNLSLNKNFIKQERPKDDPGKGNYWAIEPGMEYLFMKDKPVRKSGLTAENVPVMSTRLEPSQPAPVLAAPPPEPTLPPQFPVPAQMALPQAPASQPPPPLQPEPSSDATIPASDSAMPEDGLPRPLENDGVNDTSFYSPIPATMHSSPPIPRHVEIQHNTPPRTTKAAGSSITRSHKRKFASMDDSGYISSLESSVMRPNQSGRILTSEADRPRIKRGRAEEEIARLRASSYDSPTKGRSWNGFAPPSSSPLRQTSANGSNKMLPPLTPAAKMKAPPKPPPSVSPNTNLRLHRDKVRSMLQSPLRRVSNMADVAPPWSPGPALGPSDQTFEGIDFTWGHTADHFDIFDDSTAFLGLIETGSPEKRSAKRMRLDRSHSASILTDITNSTSRKSVTSAPFLKVPSQSNVLDFETPSKVFECLGSPSKLLSLQSPSKMPAFNDNVENVENTAAWISMDDLCAPEFLEDNDYTGLDILQGFEKIGSGTQVGRSEQKPPLGRSHTSIF
ncbi:Forkhead protein sep1 [Pleurostoma richardsiae]|uniref:Forkhead protein sep1 n=1 Tax=Pleurostoma richardsiae TaxID=41990 RepID=A0AA38VMX2_9PEZI|nr:Forkhead protein sep1 [Pleurostoma richardsiae]